MMRHRLISAVLIATFLTACGGSGSTSNAPDSSTTTLPSAKDAVRAQMNGIVTSYLENMVRQVPTVTSKVTLPDVATCVKERLNQFFDAAQPQADQPDGDFAAMLMSQAQSSLYGIVGVCAKLAG